MAESAWMQGAFRSDSGAIARKCNAADGWFLTSTMKQGQKNQLVNRFSPSIDK